MADKKISELNQVTNANNNLEFVVVNGSNNNKMTVNQLRQFIRKNGDEIATKIIKSVAQDEDINFIVNDGGVNVKIMTLDAANSRIGIKEEDPDAPLHITGTNQGGDLSSIDSDTLLLLQNNADATVSYGISAGMEFVGGYYGGAEIYNSMKCGGIGQEQLRVNKISMVSSPGLLDEGFFSSSGGGVYYRDITASGAPGNNIKDIYIRMSGASASTDVHFDTSIKKIFYVTCATETKEILEDAKLEEMLGLLNIPIKKYIVKDDPEQKKIYGVVLEDLEQFCPHLVGRGNKEITNIEEIEKAKKAKEKDDTVQIPEEETKLVGKNTALIVDNLIGICQYQQKKIEELEQRVSQLEGAK